MPLIAANGAELFYDLAGPEEAPVVAFSNSLGTTLEMWDAVAPAVLARGYRVLRYDTRGHGRSPHRPHPGAAIGDLADDLAGLLDALGIARAHIAGLSLGGMTAQSLAARRPERVASLVLMATAAHLPPRELWTERAALVRREGLGALVDGVMTRWFTKEFLAASPERVAPVRQRFVAAVEPEGYAACSEIIRDMDLRPELAGISAPTLIIAGKEDPATPVAMSEEIQALIPGAELVVLPRAAHLLAVEQPEAVASHLLAFLERNAPARPAEDPVFARGLANRRAVLGAEHVDRSRAGAGAFATPWQDFITRAAWGEIWGDPALPWKTRSMLVLAMMVALHREEEFKLHLRPALGNGVTVAELRALLLQTAVYAGVPAANAGFRWVREVLGDEADA